MVTKRNLPVGWLAALSLLASAVLFLVIIFGTFPRLRQYSRGLEPFAARAFGYSFSDAQALLAALGEDGRTYYANVQLRIDTFYPASYGISRALCFYWLAMPGRGTGQGLGARFASVSSPCHAW